LLPCVVAFGVVSAEFNLAEVALVVKDKTALFSTTLANGRVTDALFRALTIRIFPL